MYNKNSNYKLFSEAVLTLLLSLMNFSIRDVVVPLEPFVANRLNEFLSGSKSSDWLDTYPPTDHFQCFMGKIFSCCFDFHPSYCIHDLG